MRVRPKTLFTSLVGGIALVVVARGLWISGYEPVTSDNYLWGAFHVHSTMSDGLASLEEIAVQARDARVDVVLLSDHGPPHREAALLDETDEMIGGVRFIGGSEVRMPEGHLIVSGVDALPDYNLPPFPPDAVADVRTWGGFSVLTYPEDPTHRWRYWGEDFTPDGIEIINVTSYFRASSYWDKLLWAIFSIFNRYYYVSGFESPAYALERWDELLTRGQVWAFYAANAHGGFPLTEELKLGVPSYRTALSYVGFGIDRKFEGQIERAIRDGQFFSIVRGAGEPSRFELVRDEDGQVRVSLEVDDAEELSTRIVLKHDGLVAAETEENELFFQATTPGVYRVEVYLEDHALLSSDVPWILSNPIFVNVEPPESRLEGLECADIDAVDLSAFHVENDDESSASLELDPSGSLELTYDLSKATHDKVDRWVALALRQPIDLSRYRGIYIGGTGPRPMRYWIEVRAGDKGYYATFKVDQESRASAIPWSRFYPTVGERDSIPLAEIDAIFIAVNTSSSRTGFSSELTLTEIGWCR
ncbi:MAG: hypothetical protein BMS9Abin37_2017 [Acidobacteriota bacterium]|nr:MAG: hypothetical protein BMS9Abin37_2017 [Acidobacteriota bacterium]